MTPNEIINKIIEEEGGWQYTDHPADPDQGTYAGVRWVTYNHYMANSDKITPEAFAKLAQSNDNELKQTIIKIYKRDYYDKMKLDELPEPLRLPLMSCGVNCGTRTGIRLLQRACNITAQFVYEREQITADGIIGAKTIEAVNTLHEIYVKEFINTFIDTWIRYYCDILNEKNYVFMKGWFNRANKFRVY